MLAGAMIEPNSYVRSPQLMSAGDTGLLVVDVQEKLIPLIADHARIVWNCRRLLDGAAALGLPALGTEQYPRGLGSTVAELAERLGELPEKAIFSSCGARGILDQLKGQQRSKVLLCGIEAHVCVAQTALDLQAEGYEVYLAVDAIGSRTPLDKEITLRRLESSGVTLTTTEAALFEWCEQAGTPEFKQISALVKETLPGS